MVLYTMIAILFIELLLIYVVFDRDLLAPPFLFCAGFLLSALDLMTMANSWSTELHWITVCIICGSILVYAMASFVVFSINTRSRKRSVAIIYKKYPVRSIVKYNKTVLRVVFVFNVFSLLFMLLSVVQMGSRLGKSGSLLYVIGAIGDVSKFSSEVVDYGPIVTLCGLITRFSGFISGVMFATVFQQEKKINFLLLSNFIFAILFMFLQGSRGDAFLLVIGFAYTLVITLREFSRRRRIGIKYIILGVVLLGVLLGIFDALGRAMKRITADYSIWEYLSIYIGAPIQNFDTYLQEPRMKVDIVGSNTFYSIFNWIGTKLSIDEFVFVRKLPFRYANGRNLGNVYTTFYAWINDFGMIGVVVMTSIMAVITQRTYMQTCSDSKRGLLSFSRVFLLFTVSTIPLSFFGNRFFSSFMTVDFLYGLVFMALLFFIFGKVRLRLRRR